MRPECQLCGLWKYSTHNCIKGRGILDKTTNLILIGEAPGSEEAHKGQVFVGKAGRLLGHLIEPYRKNLAVYITNAVKCYPPVSTHFPEKGFRVPKESEITLCRALLIEELNQASDNVLLMPLGNTALSTLMAEKRRGITKALGKFHHVKMANNVTYTVLPNFHPSYILRNANNRPAFESVMETAVKYLHGEIECQPLQENNKTS